MARNSLPLLDGRLTSAELLAQRVLDHFGADALLVIECAPGWFALVTAGALQDLMYRLTTAKNRALADVWLNMPLGEWLRPIAKQSDVPPAGPSRRPPPASGDDLLRALGVDADTLNAHGQSAKPPDQAAESLPDEGAKEIDSLDASGSGADGDAAGGSGSKGDLGSTDNDAAVAPPSPPSPPSPAESLQREEIRLDVVTPETAVVDEPFDMAVAIRQPASPALTVDDLPKLTSALGEVYRSEGQDLIRYRVEVEVDDCEVKPARYDFLLAKGRDSIVQYFQLTPKRAGSLSIVVNAYQAESAVLAATTRVRLKAAVAVAGQAPIAQGQADAIKVYDVLTSLFSLSDVDDLATRLSINPEELAGDTLSAKCRSLVAYCNQRGIFDQLRQLMKAARPQAGL